MKNRQRITSIIGNIITWGFSSFGIIILVLIYAFIFNNGFKLLDFDFIFGDYKVHSYYAELENPKNEVYMRPQSLAKDLYFSNKWGIGLKDTVDSKKSELITIEYIDEASPFASVVDPNARGDIPFAIELGSDINRLTYNDNGKYAVTGSSKADVDAKTLVNQLDGIDTIENVFVQSEGGNIFGSIIATLLTILVSVGISIPISIASAIYLNEYSSKSKLLNYIRSGIELLAGVPSIIFGLVGVVAFYPIASMFGASGNTVLLGALTMVIVLFPVAIRTTEETLKVIPNSLREASFSLGATKTQTVLRVVLPSALPGILTAVLLSVGRVIGESAALIYTMGTIVNDHPGLRSSGTTLAVQIWKEMNGEQPNIELASAISLVILILVLIINTIVKLISNKINRKFS